MVLFNAVVLRSQNIKREQWEAQQLQHLLNPGLQIQEAPLVPLAVDTMREAEAYTAVARLVAITREEEDQAVDTTGRADLLLEVHTLLEVAEDRLEGLLLLSEARESLVVSQVLLVLEEAVKLSYLMMAQ